MAYTMKVDGLTEISKMLSNMAEKAPAAASKAVYEGAGIVADEVRAQIDKINAEPFHYAVFVTREPSPEEKEIVQQAGAGIARFSKNGTEVETSVGFAKAGYAQLKGKTVPIAKIANAINSGTSFMRKQPFMRKASNSGGRKALDAMKNSIEASFEEMKK